MELYLQRLFGLHVYSCTHGLRPRNPPPPHLGSYTRVLLVNQDSRHLFMTSCPRYTLDKIRVKFHLKPPPSPTSPHLFYIFVRIAVFPTLGTGRGGGL
jgi:hypothetical protein